MFAAPEEAKELLGAKFFYKGVGNHLIKQTRYHKSLDYYEKAIELTPKNLEALLGRSTARAKLAYYQCALDDVYKAKEAWPDDMRPLQKLAQYKFLKTDFEEAFVLNTRGLEKRKCPPHFSLGILQCAEEVERTIGKHAKHALLDHSAIIRIIAWKKALEARNGPVWKPKNKPKKRRPKKTDNTPQIYTTLMKQKKQAKSTESEKSLLETLEEETPLVFLNQIPKVKNKYSPPQKRTTNIDNLMCEKYMERLSYDINFLKNLRHDPRIISPNIKGTQLIEVLSRKAYRKAAYRQEILRTRLPFYSIKYDEMTTQGTSYLQREKEALEKVQAIARHDVETLLAHLNIARLAKETNVCLKIADLTKTFIDKKSSKHLPDKEKYLKQLYDIIGLVHYDNYRLKAGMKPEELNARYSFLFGLPLDKVPSNDSVIRNNKVEFENVNKIVTLTENRMSKATTPLEIIWLYYDLARYNLKLKKYDHARLYLRKAFNLTQILDDLIWQINVCLLTVRSHVLQHNRNEVRSELIKTFKLAKAMGNRNLMLFIKMCVEGFEISDDAEINLMNVIHQREKEITKTILDSNIQEDLRLLFMRMDAVPRYRRMSIMPGIILKGKSGLKSRRKPGTPKPSIKPKIDPGEKTD